MDSYFLAYPGSKLSFNKQIFGTARSNSMKISNDGKFVIGMSIVRSLKVFFDTFIKNIQLDIRKDLIR